MHLLLANVNMGEITIADFQASFQLWTDLGLIDQRVQIGGLCVIMDLTNLKRETLMQMFEPKSSKGNTKYFQVRHQTQRLDDFG